MNIQKTAYNLATAAHDRCIRTSESRLYLSFVPSTETQNGAFEWRGEEEPLPEGWELVSGQSFPVAFWEQPRIAAEILPLIRRCPVLPWK